MPHKLEHDLPSARRIRQAVFGISHGIVSILSLLAGLAAAGAGRVTIVITGTIGVCAGAVTLLSIEYLAAKSQKETVEGWMAHERTEWKRKPAHELKEMVDYYRKAGFAAGEVRMIVKRISKKEGQWLEAHAAHVLHMFPGEVERPGREALTLAGFHVVGGVIPLLPFVLVPVDYSLATSIFASLVLIFVVGCVKARITMKHWAWSGAEMLVLTTAAVAVTFVIGTIAG